MVLRHHARHDRGEPVVAFGAEPGGDHLGVANFKNFVWSGKGPKDVPLGEGVVGKEYVAMLKQTSFSGPVTLHVEYLEGNVHEEGYLNRAIEATRRDLAVLKSWWA